MLSTSNILNKIKNLVFPRFNSDFEFYDKYLCFEDIHKQKHFIKTPETEIKKEILVCSEYKGRIKELVYSLKFFQEKAVAESFTLLIKEKADKIKLHHPDLIISVPADPLRSLIRGYHPPEEICNYLRFYLNVKSIDLLRKKKSSKSQMDLKGKDRLGNLKGIFDFKDEVVLSDFKKKQRVVWIVDDICTTGSTLMEVYNLLKKENPKNNYFLIAVSGKK